MRAFVIQFPYSALVVKKGCRVAIVGGFTDGEQPVLVDEIESADAPVAAVFNPAEGEPVVFRQIKGRLMSPFSMLGAPNGGRGPVRVDDFEERMRQFGQPWRFPFDRPSGVDEWLDAKAPLREIRWNGRTKAANRLAALFSDAVFVDGVLHLRDPGPQWRVRDVVGATELRATSRFFPGKGNYRADRYPEALLAARARNDAKDDHRGAPPELRIVGEIDVRRPEAFILDDDWGWAKLAVDAFVEGNAPFVGAWPMPAARAYLELRDARTRWTEAATPEMLGVLREALAQCVACRDAACVQDLSDAAMRLQDRPGPEPDPPAAPAPRKP